MHARGLCCSSHRRSKSCADLGLFRNIQSVHDQQSLRLTSCLIFTSHRVEAFRNLFQFDVMTLPMTNNDRLNKAVDVLRLGCKCLNWSILRGQIFSELQ